MELLATKTTQWLEQKSNAVSVDKKVPLSRVSRCSGWKCMDVGLRDGNTVTEGPRSRRRYLTNGPSKLAVDQKLLYGVAIRCRLIAKMEEAVNKKGCQGRGRC